MQTPSFLGTAAIVIAWSSSALAAQFHVRTDGSDTTCSGLVDRAASSSGQCAFKTIQRAVDALTAAGDKVTIHAGTYPEYVHIDENHPNGTERSPIVIEGDPNVPTKDVVIDGSSFDGALLVNGSSGSTTKRYFVFQHFSLKTGKLQGMEVGTFTAGYAALSVIRDIEVHSINFVQSTPYNSRVITASTWAGGPYGSNAHMLIENVTIDNAENGGVVAPGVGVFMTADSSTLRNADIRHVHALGRMGSGATVEFNRMVFPDCDCDDGCVQLYNGSALVFRYNTMLVTGNMAVPNWRMIGIRGINNPYASAVIANNVFEYRGTSQPSYAIVLDQGTQYASITHNVFIGFDNHPTSGALGVVGCPNFEFEHNALYDSHPTRTDVPPTCFQTLPPSNLPNTATVDFDPQSYVPSPGSRLVDAGNPALSIPVGGGGIVDIGAYESGAGDSYPYEFELRDDTDGPSPRLDWGNESETNVNMHPPFGFATQTGFQCQIDDRSTFDSGGRGIPLFDSGPLADNRSAETHCDATVELPDGVYYARVRFANDTPAAQANAGVWSDHYYRFSIGGVTLGTGGAGGSPGTGGGSGVSGTPNATSFNADCGCRMVGRPAHRGALFALLLLAAWRRRRLAGLAACALAATCARASGDGGAVEAGTTGSANGGAGGAPTCTDCEDGTVCVGGVCCDAARACGSACCGSHDVCSFGMCVTPGAECSDASDCPPGEYCEYLLGEPNRQQGPCVGGSGKTGRCLPKPPICPPGTRPDPNDPACLESCEHHPTTTSFQPVLKYQWPPPQSTIADRDVVATPVVIQLDDDDCDGKVGADDIPELVLASWSQPTIWWGGGTLRALSVLGGQLVEKWALPNAVHASSGIAAGDLDGDGVAEIVACKPPPSSCPNCCSLCTQATGVVAFKMTSSVPVKLWETDASQVHCGFDYPAIADPEGTGHPLVLVGMTLIDGQTGTVVEVLEPPAERWPQPHLSGFADVDMDGVLDVVTGQKAFRTNGTVLWDLGQMLGFGYHAIGDLDLDGKPEVVFTSFTSHSLHVVRYDAASPSGVAIVRTGVDINGNLDPGACPSSSVGAVAGGGPPTIADFDGDGTPDVGVAGGVGYAVFNGNKLMDPSVANAATLLWAQPTHDCSSAATGSSVFDFNGDGRAEVVYSDEIHLWMYDGQTGNSLIPETCNTTGTLWEYPVIADVDNDGQADVVAVSNGSLSWTPTCQGNKTSGVRVFGSSDGSWVRTRRVWNSHTYHVTNVDETGSIPLLESFNWTVPGLNDYRQNRQPGLEFAAPNAMVSLAPACADAYGLLATVRNLGEAALASGVAVSFYAEGTTAKLGSAFTTDVLYPLEAEQVFLPLPNAPVGVVSGSTLVYAVVDDPSHEPALRECRIDDNTSAKVSAKCAVPR